MHVRVRITDPGALEELRRFLRRQGCPSVVVGPDMLEVSVMPPHPDALRFDRLDRDLIQRHLRDFSTQRFGVRADVVHEDPWRAEKLA